MKMYVIVFLSISITNRVAPREMSVDELNMQERVVEEFIKYGNLKLTDLHSAERNGKEPYNSYNELLDWVIDINKEKPIPKFKGTISSESKERLFVALQNYALTEKQKCEQEKKKQEEILMAFKKN